MKSQSSEFKSILKALNSRPIAYYPIYADITGSVKCGVLLSQLMYWWTAIEGEEFYKTDEEIRGETRLSVRELKSAKKQLKTLGLFNVTVKGVPAKTYYKLNENKLLELINGSVQTSLVKTYQLDGPKRTNKLGQNVPTIYITENTTETTTENINNTHQSDSLLDLSKSSSHPPPLSPEKTAKESFQNDFIKKIVDKLNETAKRNFRWNIPKTKRLITARLGEGYSARDFENVIEKKCREWMGTQFEQYLRPETLFGTKFESYVNQPSWTAVKRNNTKTNGALQRRLEYI